MGSIHLRRHFRRNLPAVIPAEAGIHFALSLGASRKPPHVHVSSIDVPVDRLLSFACPKESNQRKGHPRGRGRRGIHAPATSRAGSRVCRQYVRVLTANSPASCQRSLRDFSSACSPRPGGNPGKSRARQSLPQKRERGGVRKLWLRAGFRSHGVSCFMRRFAG